ncbi:MAG TPA: MarR family transcriptional regulator [Ktedonobacteraceae bacterium]
MMNTADDMSMTDYRALAELRYQIRRFLRFSEQAAREVGLVPQQHQLLLALKGLPAGRKATISELAERLQIQHHSTVELIDRLVERGLIKRLRDEVDQRRVIIHLTPQGEQILRRLSLLHRHELQLAGPAFVRTLGALIAGDTDTAEVAQGSTDVPQKHVEE